MKQVSGKLAAPSRSGDALRPWLEATGAEKVVAALAEAMPDAAVFAVDGQRRVVYWSPGAEALLGFSADEVIGEHCLKSNRCAPCLRGCAIAEGDVPAAVPITLYAKDGRPVRLRKTARAFFDREGQFAGGIEVLSPDTSPSDDLQPVQLPSDAVSFHGLVSRDPELWAVFATIRNVAETDATTLVRGESGTGKELVARALHQESHRKRGPFVAVNCSALTATLLESELFGHKKGAFTGAIADRAGLFERANGGTLFLDEVAELAPDLQAKLLRVLEEREVVPVGGTRPVEVDVRVVAATHRSLRAEAKAGRFREDLLYRLRVVPIFLPPLRNRLGDIELLLRYFIAEHNKRGPRRVDAVDPEAMRALLDHSWPGNVRELKNAVEYAFAVGRGTSIRSDELPPELRARSDPAALRMPSPGDEARRRSALSTTAAPSGEDEVARLRAALAATGGHIGKAAELLGMSRPTLWRKRKKYGM